MRYLCVACCLNWGKKSRSPQAKQMMPLARFSCLILVLGQLHKFFIFGYMLDKILERKEFN